MKTSLNIQEDLLDQAMKATGITEKTAVIHKGLEELVRKAARERLIKLQGSDPRASSAPRKRLFK